MKKIQYTILGILLIFALGSCKKFLTVTPKTQMPQDILFSTEGGFKDALTGIYIQLKDGDVYGEQMTQSTIEYLVSSWDVTANTTEQRLGLFNYTDAGAVPKFSAIWSQEYKIIAGINAILAQIDAKANVFSSPDMYAMIKSECLGLRAYCHLDILRLFGPIPDSASAITLPYATVLSTTPQAYFSIDQFKTKLLQDLTDAEMLIKDKDPIQEYSLDQLKSPDTSFVFSPQDNFTAYRYLRMNYYAIKALQARAYLYFHTKDKAYECAKLVIDAKNADNAPKFRLGTSAELSATTTKDYVLHNEHIFGLYTFDLFNRYQNLYAKGILKKGTALTTVTTTLYGSTGTDIREANLWKVVTLGNLNPACILKKYDCDNVVALSSDFKQIPMLRLSEMYLIAAEAAPFAEGVGYFKTFRTARNIGNKPDPANELELQTEILKEYRKEFYAEGQAFFAYKRVNAPRTSIIFAPATAVVNYVVPIPQGEIK